MKALVHDVMGWSEKQHLDVLLSLLILVLLQFRLAVQRFFWPVYYIMSILSFASWGVIYLQSDPGSFQSVVRSVQESAIWFPQQE